MHYAAGHELEQQLAELEHAWDAVHPAVRRDHARDRPEMIERARDDEPENLFANAGDDGEVGAPVVRLELEEP